MSIAEVNASTVVMLNNNVTVTEEKKGVRRDIIYSLGLALTKASVAERALAPVGLNSLTVLALRLSNRASSAMKKKEERSAVAAVVWETLRAALRADAATIQPNWTLKRLVAVVRRARQLVQLAVGAICAWRLSEVKVLRPRKTNCLERAGHAKPAFAMCVLCTAPKSARAAREVDRS